MPRFLLFYFSLLAPVCAFAASVGSVQGRVMVEGTTLSPVGAKVSAGGQTADVAADGTYSLYNLIPKTYDIAVDWPEIGTQVKPGIEVTGQDPVVLDFTFPPTRPELSSIYPPLLTKAQVLTITGRHFLHAANASLEVRINDKPIAAVRKSDTQIEIGASAMTTLIQSLGSKQSVHELPVVVKINGVASLTFKIAYHSTVVGGIAGELILSNPKLPVTGARLHIPERQMDVAITENRRFDLSKMPPRKYQLILEWAAVGITQKQDFEVLPGQTLPVKFKLEMPAPVVSTVSPAKLEKAEPVLLKGNFFHHSLKAPFEVTIGEMKMRAQRISNHVIAIPKESIEKLLETYPSRPDLTGKVTVAGVESAKFALPVPGAQRETAAEATPAPAAPAAPAAEPEKRDVAATEPEKKEAPTATADAPKTEGETEETETPVAPTSP